MAKQVVPVECAPWLRTDTTAREAQSHIDGLDALASEMEQTWGIGRLRLLVDADLRAKFDAQADKTDKALRSGTVEEVATECRRMANAWRALARAACEAGKGILNPDIWEVVADDGSIIKIVRDNAAAAHVLKDGFSTSVYTLDEIKNLIAGFPALVKVKDQWPGAVVVRAGVGRAVRFNDPIPF